MRKLSSVEQKTIQLEILDSIHDFCESRGLIYSLCGGTMIGAVRHQGYIPWDDDIDLMMPREDYERFKASYHDPCNEVIDLSLMDACEEQFMKVSRRGTLMEDIVAHRRLWGVNVDIFPVDGMPEDYLPYTRKLQDIHAKIAENCPYYKTVSHNKFYWLSRYFIKRLVKMQFVNTLELKSFLNEQALAHLPQDSPLSTVIYGDFKIFPFPTSMFYDIKEVRFEGKMYKCISNSDLYLRTVYGDYMTLPPKEKQVTHHLYDSFIL